MLIINNISIELFFIFIFNNFTITIILTVITVITIMGNFVSKRNSNYSTLEMPLLDSYQLTSNQRNSRELLNYIEILRNEIRQYAQNNSTLEEKIDNISAKYQNNIYTLNEQINLVNKDLQSLLNNDKILLEKINSSQHNITPNNTYLNQDLESSKRHDTSVMLPNPYYQQQHQQPQQPKLHRSVTFESPFLEEDAENTEDTGNF